MPGRVARSWLQGCGCCSCISSRPLPSPFRPPHFSPRRRSLPPHQKCADISLEIMQSLCVFFIASVDLHLRGVAARRRRGGRRSLRRNMFVYLALPLAQRLGTAQRACSSICSRAGVGIIPGFPSRVSSSRCAGKPCAPCQRAPPAHTCTTHSARPHFPRADGCDCGR